MGKQIIFRLTEKRTPASWSISGGFAVKEGKGRKLINYYPGSDSYFVEDQTSDIPAQEVTFIYNDILSDPATEIVVDEDNIALVGYLKAHPFFNLHYYIHDESKLDENKLADYDKIEKAFSLIKENEDLKVQAMALAIFKMDAFGWTAIKARAELKEKATTNPDIIINAIESDKYESKYLSALAFYSGIVREDSMKSAVVWNDEDLGVILPIAKGENGINALADFISVESAASLLVYQEIGHRVQKKLSPIADIKVENAQIITGKTEAEIADAAIEAYKATLIPAKTEEQIIAEYLAKNQGAPDSAFIPETSDKKDSVKTFDPTNLDDVHAKYKEVTGKDVPVNMKNKLEWLNAEIVKGI
jgi:hypothetical protein